MATLPYHVQTRRVTVGIDSAFPILDAIWREILLHRAFVIHAAIVGGTPDSNSDTTDSEMPELVDLE